MIATVKNKSSYPNFYNSVITSRIASELELDFEEPYILIESVEQNSVFYAGKAKTFDEEKNVADKAPVEGVKIVNISSSKETNKNDTKLTKKFNYIIKIADFYYKDSAELVKERIMTETKIKHVNIDKTSVNNYRLSIGPYKSLVKLKKDFEQMENLYFENLELIKKMKKLILFLLQFYLQHHLRRLILILMLKLQFYKTIYQERFEKDPDMSIYPASMTKIMTSIIAFDLIKKGQLSLDEKFIVSENAWRLANAGYSSMFIMVGDEVSVENLLKGIIVASGNDACVTLAEGIAGSEEEFAVMMTSKAKEIGMNNTNFSNASG